VAIAIVGAVLFGQLAWTSNVHTTITEIAPKEHVAVLYGITGAAGNGLGALVQPLIGWVVDSYGYNPAFLCAGLTYVVAIIFVAAMGRIEPISGRKA
jgi:ACS family hexuronate transporter-like MFS transporter